MIKYITLAIASLWMTTCAAHDEDYYRVHPKMLQQALQTCSEKQSAGAASCEQLKRIAIRVSESVYQLRLDPQAYGQKILFLQQTIAKQEAVLREKSNQSELQTLLKDNKRDLQERLAIVKWFESPEG